MSPLKIQSEQIAQVGGATGQGIMRALGRPRLDHISVLVREAVQNSWDARIASGKSQTVAVNVRLEKFSPAQMAVLTKTVFAEKPTHHPLKEKLRQGLRRLIIEDRSTVGLGGPVFVERPPTPADRFVNFIRMFGRAAEGPLGGGTFGYGKAVYFSASHAATIIIHTRCQDGAKVQERLIAMSLWQTNDKELDTGRHWWGIPNEKHRGAIGPVTGHEAKKLAGAIGFTPFSEDETGTSIMILAPRFDGILEQHPDMAARCLAESMTIWFWPRMLGAADGLGKLAFSVWCDGAPISVPDPKKDAPFNGYAIALNNLVGRARRDREVQQPHVVHEVRSIRPAARLGYLSLALTPRHHRGDFAIVSRIGDVQSIEDHAFADQVDEAGDQMPSCHHVALIRAPGQVIKYVACRPYPDSVMEYAGVFLVDGDPERKDRPADDVDVAFARAEPPSHDDWVPDDLADDWHKRYVRIAYKEIRGLVDGFVDVGKSSIDAVSQDPLGAISAELGELMAAPGSGASKGSKSGPGHGGGGGGGGGGGNGVQIQITGDGTLEEMDGRAVFILPFRLDGELPIPAVVRANPKVLVAGGGTEQEAPTGDGQPRVVGWRKSGKKTVSNTDLTVKNGDQGDWQVVVDIPGEAMVGVSLSVINP